MSQVDRAAKGVWTSFLQFGCQFGLQILLAPVVLSVAGQELLGAYAVIMQAVAYLALTDLGFSLALTRFLSQAFGRADDNAQFEVVLTTCRTILFGTNTLFAILLMLLAVWCVDLFSFSEEVALQTQYSLVFLAIWAVLRTPLLVFREGLNASQNMGTANLISIVANACRLVFSLGLVVLGMGLIGLVLANIIGEALDLLLCYIRFRSLYPSVKPRWGLPDRGLFFEMVGFSKHALFINLAWRLVSGTDNLVVGYLYGAAATSIYYTTQMPTVMGYLLVNKVVDNLGPAINELFAKKDFVTLKVMFLKVHRYAFLLSSPLFLGILLLNQQMIGAWVGPDQYAGNLMTFALACFALLHTIGHVNWVFIIANGQMRQLSRLALVEGILNLILSFLLGHHYGLSGVMLATLIAHLPMVVYLHQKGMGCVGVSTHQYFCEVIFPIITPCLVAFGCAYVVFSFIPNNGWLSFICSAIVLLGVHFCLAFLLAIDAGERKWILQKLHNLGQIVFT